MNIKNPIPLHIASQDGVLCNLEIPQYGLVANPYAIFVTPKIIKAI